MQNCFFEIAGRTIDEISKWQISKPTVYFFQNTPNQLLMDDLIE